QKDGELRLCAKRGTEDFLEHTAGVQQLLILQVPAEDIQGDAVLGIQGILIEFIEGSFFLLSCGLLFLWIRHRDRAERNLVVIDARQGRIRQRVMEIDGGRTGFPAETFVDILFESEIFKDISGRGQPEEKEREKRYEKEQEQKEETFF